MQIETEKLLAHLVEEEMTKRTVSFSFQRWQCDAHGLVSLIFSYDNWRKITNPLLKSLLLLLFFAKQSLFPNTALNTFTFALLG